MNNVHHLFEMNGRIAVLTGATAGLGYDMAVALAEYGCKIVITSRDESKAVAAAQKLTAETGAEAFAG